MPVRAAIIGILVLSLAGCSLIRPRTGEGVAAQALPYRAKVTRDAEDSRTVAVSVDAKQATLDQVRESARFPVTRYCLTFFGASEADWARDPSTGDWAFTRNGETLVLMARCTAR